MTAEQNKAVVRRYLEEVWARGDSPAADELITPDYRNHDPPPGTTPDRAGFFQALSIFAAAFPDADLTVEHLIAEGDLVAARWTLRATHRGDFFGSAPTGRAITLKGLEINRIAGGRIAESWQVVDTLGLLRQLGADPKKTQS